MRFQTWYVLVFMAMTALTGTISTITATPASTEAPRFCKKGDIKAFKYDAWAKRPNFCEITHLPQEVKGQNDLQRSWPDHVDVGDEVHETLSVYRHEIHNLSYGGCSPGGVGNDQSLTKMNRQHYRCACNAVTAQFHVHIPSCKRHQWWLCVTSYRSWSKHGNTSVGWAFAHRHKLTVGWCRSSRARRGSWDHSRTESATFGTQEQTHVTGMLFDRIYLCDKCFDWCSGGTFTGLVRFDHGRVHALRAQVSANSYWRFSERVTAVVMKVWPPHRVEVI